jgi:hypothetical protein
VTGCNNQNATDRNAPKAKKAEMEQPHFRLPVDVDCDLYSWVSLADLPLVHIYQN